MKILLVFVFLFAVSCNYKQDPYENLEHNIRKGDIEQVRKILDEGIDVNPKKKNWTPLMIAVLRNNAEMVDLLLEYKSDIHGRNNKGQTPLHLASRWGHPEMAAHLMKRGAFVESRDWLSWTPLMWASLRGRSELAEVLLKNGANPNVRDIDGNTPLILTAYTSQNKTAALLISYGANKYIANKAGETVCDTAKKKNFEKFLKTIGSCKK